MNIQLSEHFTYGKLLRFTLPSIVMMAFSSIYGVVDGVFVSNYVGADPFAAITSSMPSDDPRAWALCSAPRQRTRGVYARRRQ